MGEIIWKKISSCVAGFAFQLGGNEKTGKEDGLLLLSVNVVN